MPNDAVATLFARKLGDGRTECQTCGKWVWEVTHSCKGVPVTEAARARAMLPSACNAMYDGFAEKLRRLT
mgnify:CR=1 FL=1